MLGTRERQGSWCLGGSFGHGQPETRGRRLQGSHFLVSFLLPFPRLWRAGGHPASIGPGVLILWPSSPPLPSWELSTSLSLLCQILQQDTMSGAGPRMETWAQNSGQGGIPKADPQGPRGETQDRAEASGRGPS